MNRILGSTVAAPLVLVVVSLFRRASPERLGSPLLALIGAEGRSLAMPGIVPSPRLFWQQGRRTPTWTVCSSCLQPPRMPPASPPKQTICFRRMPAVLCVVASPDLPCAVQRAASAIHSLARRFEASAGPAGGGPPVGCVCSSCEAHRCPTSIGAALPRSACTALRALARREPRSSKSAGVLVVIFCLLRKRARGRAAVVAPMTAAAHPSHPLAWAATGQIHGERGGSAPVMMPALACRRRHSLARRVCRIALGWLRPVAYLRSFSVARLLEGQATW